MDSEFIKEVLSNPKGRGNSRYIKIHHPSEYYEILKHNGSTFAEQLYNYIYNDPLHKCPVCGKDTKFKSITSGYSECCSVKCSSINPNRIEKIQSTTFERYGVRNASQSEEVKRKKEETCMKNYGVRSGLCLRDKIQNTTFERYGVRNASQSEEIKRKKEETCMKNYGVRSGLCLRDKIQSTMLERYGVRNASHSVVIQDKRRKRHRENFIGTNVYHIGYTDNGDWLCECPKTDCVKCEERTFEIDQVTYHDRMRNGSELCTRLMPVGFHNQGTTIEVFIRDILDRYNIGYVNNTKDVIYPNEIDIYIPSKSIAIECNGVFWHSRKYPNYHIDKYVRCKENGIQLLSLWEDWIKRKPYVVESIIKHKLGIITNKIPARACEVKELDSKVCTTFLEENHIQGASPSSIKYGLYYKKELVSVMTFSKGRCGVGKNNMGYELVRFCNKIDYTVVGGASKLLKYFIRKHTPSNIYSYSSNDISNGALYACLGFVPQNKINRSYWYIKHGTLDRYHRFNFRKQKLRELGYDTTNKTERQIMNELPYYCIYDSGTTRWDLRCD